MKKRRYFLLMIGALLIFCISFIFLPTINVKAESLNDNIENQLNNLDLTKVEYLSNDLDSNVSFLDNFYKIINGEYSVEYNSFFSYIKELTFQTFLDFLPILLTIIAISVFASLINNSKSVFAGDGVGSIINLVCYLTVILLLSGKIFEMFNTTKNIIENISKINEIMSPIIITLMIASGGTVSASVYKPTVTFFSNGVINVILLVIFPIIILILIFGIISVFSKNIKFNKFVDFFTSTIKWIIGILIACFSLFLTIQGLSSAIHDGISLKAAKFAISNSIPLVGGFFKDTFDLTIAGSILIKNAIGVSGIILLFSYIIVPVLQIAIFSLILKLTSAFCESIADNKTSELCTNISKAMSYLNVVILLTGFMLFMTILLMIFSANTLI